MRNGIRRAVPGFHPHERRGRTGNPGLRATPPAYVEPMSVAHLARDTPQAGTSETRSPWFSPTNSSGRCPRHGGRRSGTIPCEARTTTTRERAEGRELPADRKSTRLNSSHLVISYAVFCLKKKKK